MIAAQWKCLATMIKPPSVTSITAAVSGLPTSRFASAEDASIGGTGRRNAEMGQAGPAEVLDQRQWSGLLDEDHDAVAVNRTWKPGWSSAGGVRLRSHNWASVGR